MLDKARQGKTRNNLARVESVINKISIFYYVLAFLCLAWFLMRVFGIVKTTAKFGKAFLTPASLVFTSLSFAIVMVVGFVYFKIGQGLRRGKRWALILSIISSFLLMMSSLTTLVEFKPSHPRTGFLLLILNVLKLIAVWLLIIISVFGLLLIVLTVLNYLLLSINPLPAYANFLTSLTRNAGVEWLLYILFWSELVIASFVFGYLLFSKQAKQFFKQDNVNKNKQ
ncbi:hypothetical protein J7L02_02825 [Candidatus Woesearchaeota archaeon]|nr:hypothetical protein [Candidatus Woesearchaeota archaeon]